MADPLSLDPDLEWLDHVQPVGLVVAPSLIKELGLAPTVQNQLDNAVVAELLSDDDEGPALADPWAFVERVLGWTAPTPLDDALAATVAWYRDHGWL